MYRYTHKHISNHIYSYLGDSSDVVSIRLMTMVVAGSPSYQALAYKKFLKKVSEASDEKRRMVERFQLSADIDAIRYVYFLL
jgi:hypothetical protein